MNPLLWFAVILGACVVLFCMVVFGALALRGMRLWRSLTLCIEAVLREVFGNECVSPYCEERGDHTSHR